MHEGRLPAEAYELWEANAGWWADGFTEGADPEYVEQILPLAARYLAGAKAVVDIGCGEGQIARLAAALPGVERVAAIDPTWAQLSLAAQRNGLLAPDAIAPALIRAGAGALPFAEASFDGAIACLVFEHIEDIDGALQEVGRVLAPGGRFVLMLNHPLFQVPGSGWVDDTILEEQYWRVGPYLVEACEVVEVEKDVWLPFNHRPLSRYVNAMADAGLVVVRMEEPVPPPGFLALAEEYADASTIPRLLLLAAEKR